MAVPSIPVKRWNFHKTKWSHDVALTNKFAKTLLLPDSLDVDAAYQDFCNTIKKAPKSLSHTSIEITMFRIGMQSMNPSIKLSCSFLRETTQVWLLPLCLPSLTESGGIDGPRQFGTLNSHTLVEKRGVFRTITHVSSPSSGIAQNTILARHTAEATCGLGMGCWC